MLRSVSMSRQTSILTLRYPGLVADAPRVLCDVHLNRAQLRLRRLDWDRAVIELEAAEVMANRLDLPRSYGHLASTLGDLFAARSESSKGKARTKHLKRLPSIIPKRWMHM